MSSNLRKLRFMQKSDDKAQPPSEKVVNTLIGDESVWVREGFEEVHRSHDEKAENRQKYHRIRHLTRRSYNGANPCIESLMLRFGRRSEG